jgi:hypothetical protein
MWMVWRLDDDDDDKISEESKQQNVECYRWYTKVTEGNMRGKKLRCTRLTYLELSTRYNSIKLTLITFHGTKWKDNWEVWIERDMKRSGYHVYLCTNLASCLENLLTTTLWTSVYAFPHTAISLHYNCLKNEKLLTENRILVTEWLSLVCLNPSLWKVMI